LEKIAKAAVFVADITPVGMTDPEALQPNIDAKKRSEPKYLQNPNVMCELGYAEHALSQNRIILVANAAHYPGPSALPFDWRHRRGPNTYRLMDGATKEEISAESVRFSKLLESFIKPILENKSLGKVVSNPGEPHPHDIDLLGKFHEQIPDNLIVFLRQHDFGGAFFLEQLHPIREFTNSWHGAKFEFHDTIVQASFVALFRAAEDFCTDIALKIYANDSNPKLGSPKTDVDRARGIQPATQNAIDQLNEKANALVRTIDDFERVTRDRFRVSVRNHNNPGT
jgi:hypothetical protein